MSLKKPSEYFKKETLTIDKSVKNLVKTPELNTFSDAFESFKNNLGKIEVLSEFSETLDNYRVNIERVNFLSEKVEDIQTEVQTLLKKEDLDRAMMSQLLVVEQSIRDIQSKVKGINEKNLTEIRLDVSGLTESVNEFLEVEVPKYKKLVVDSEIRTNNRYEELEENVNKTLEGIGEFVDNKYQELTENLQGINEQSLSGIIQDFKLLDELVLKLKEEEIPKYKGFIVETERKTEVKLEEFNQKLDESLDELNQKVDDTLTSFDEKIIKRVNNIQESLQEFIQFEAPKYNKLLIENKLKTEEEVKIIQKNIEEKVEKFVNDIEDLRKTALTDSENLNQYLEKIENCLNQFGSLKEEFEITEKLSDEWRTNVSLQLEEKIQNHRELVNEEISTFQGSLIKKVTDLEIEIVRNESHIKKQNQNLEQIQEDVRSTIQKLNLEELEEKNYELIKKIKYLEEVFEKFSEKEILSENIIVEPTEVKNQDPLTPLDQNFVTLEQLNQHYRLFINRIQQQLATIGGGGETRLEFLDDVDRDSVKQNGYVLQYNSSTGKFIGTSYVPGGGGGTGESYWSQGIVGIVTTSNVGIKTDNPTSVLTVNGDALVIGVVTATDFNSASDIKLKENISVIDNPLDKIIKLEGVNFQWKETGKKSLGVIAQEVEKILPELVSGDENKTVNYNGIIGLLIECVKEQQKEIEILKKLIDK